MKFLALALCLLLSGAAFASEHGGGGGAGPAGIVALEPLVINLSDAHYIQFKPNLKLKDAKDMDFVKSFIPMIRFELIKSLIGKQTTEVGTSVFISTFSESAAAVINKALKDDYIKEVLFDAWLIQ